MNSEFMDALCKKIQDHYVIVDSVPIVVRHMGERFASGAYSSLKSKQFAERITCDLREVSGDLHFKLTYSEKPRTIKDETDFVSPEEQVEFQRIAAFKNFGCERIERLPGNVGFWKINEFYDLIDKSGPSFVASMNLLKHTSALIVDVRGNTGGDPATVSLVCSFFFGSDPILLNVLEKNQDKTKQQWWTLPHLDCERYLEKPVYILIDHKTFSAAEEFAYNLKSLKRAKIIGKRSAGAAHIREQFQLNEHFTVNIPTERPVNPYTGSNWEKVGVEPDIELDSDLCREGAYYFALNSVADMIGLSEDEATEIEGARRYLLEQNSWLPKHFDV